MSTPKRDSRLVFAIVIGICLLFVITYAGRLARKARLDSEIARWETKIEQSNKHQFALEAELRYVQSDAYVEKLAHDEFGMVKEGEELVVIVPTDQHESLTPAIDLEKAVAEPFWRQWLNRLGFTPPPAD